MSISNTASNVKATTPALERVVIPFKPRQTAARDSLPVVDIDGLDDPNPSVRRRTAGRIGEIAMDNGFLYLNQHGVDPELIKAVYDQAKHFFAKPTNEKNKLYIGHSRNHRGYVPTTEKGDYADEQGPRRYEAFDMGLDLPATDPDYLAGNPLIGPNLWPDQPGFKFVLSNYFAEMRRISETMFRAFEIVLDLPTGFFAAHMKKPVSQVRLLHYLQNDAPASDKNVNMGAHTDYECFTILHSQTPSLQVMDLDSNWIDAPPIDNTFYFNIGDMLEAWSGGLFVSTPHRVINRGEERYSIPYFAATDYNAIVSPVSTNKYAAMQEHYEPVVAGEHLLSQLLRDFPYLRRRFEAGLINLPSLRTANPFEHRISAST